MQGNPFVMRHVDWRGRGAPIDRCQPTRVAMGQDIDSAALLACGGGLDQAEPMLCLLYTSRCV